MLSYTKTVVLNCTKQFKSGVPLRVATFASLVAGWGLIVVGLYVAAVPYCTQLGCNGGWFISLSFAKFMRDWATDRVTYVEPGTGSTAIDHIVDQSNS